MAPYQHQVSSHRKSRRATRVKRIAIVVVLIGVVASGAIGLDWFLGQLSSSNTVVSRENTTSVQSANVSVYRTEYYQFQAPEEWVFVSSKSTDDKFVYVKNDNQLVTQRFIVYVNRPIADTERDMSLTHVLPVTILDNRRLEHDKTVSSHCGESEEIQTLRANSRITFESVSFVCSRSSQQYNVVVGEKDGNELLVFDRGSGTSTDLTLVYSNLTAYPNTGDLNDIVSSFEVL